MKKSNKQSKLDFSTLIDDYCSNEFNTEYNQFPSIKRNRGDCQAILIAANKYKTNFLTSLYLPFFQRQEKYINIWVVNNKLKIEKKQMKYIQYEINNWNYKQRKNVKFESRIKDFILEQRNILNNPKDLNEEWLRKNPSVILSYYFHINRYYSKHKIGNRFRLAPLCKIKSHFLTIDNTILREILKNVIHQSDSNQIKIPDWIRKNVQDKDMNTRIWKAIFNYNGLRRQMNFSNRVETDGTKINFHFQVTNKNKAKKTKRRNQKTNKNTRVISIDPGRVNMITAYDEEKKKYFTLTRKYYYRACGMKSVVKKNNIRNLKIKAILEAMSHTSTKSIHDLDWYQYQQLVVRYYDELWSFFATEERRRENFKVKRLREKCLDRFLNQFQERGESKPTLVYGAATINPTSKGELSVPIKYIYDKCSQRYKTIKIDEKYTTMMHFKCKEETCGVIQDRKNIRGLRWCPTCRELVSRDRNACKNIGLIYRSEKRPEYLSETRNEKKGIFKLKVKTGTPPITKTSLKEVLKLNE